VRIAPEAAARLPGIDLPLSGGGELELDAAARRLLFERAAVVVTAVRGAGRVLYIGTDSTWKWRFRFGDELCRRFWGQVVRWAVSTRLGAADDHVRLGTDRIVYEPHAAVTIEALVESATGKPYEGPLVDATIVRARDGATRRLRLELVPKSGGRYRGVARLDAMGIDAPPPGEASGRSGVSASPEEYSVRVEVPDIPGYSQKDGRASATFAVEPPREEELSDIACDADRLRRIAEAAGGTFLPFYRFREAPSLMRDASKETVEVRTLVPFDHPWIVAALLLGILFTEWILRKLRDLV
jgi:hypothetical protein